MSRIEDAINARNQKNEQAGRLSSHASDSDHNKFSNFEEDDEEDKEVSDVSVPMPTAPGEIINRKTKKNNNKSKVRHEEEGKEEK